MKNPNTRKKLFAVLKAGFWGMALSLGFSVILFFIKTINLSLALVLMIPPFLLGSIFGINHTKLVNSFAFMVFANALAVTFIFVAFACFWQFAVKGDDKNKK